MQRARKNFPMLVVSLFAIAALSFGASEAMAADPSMTCMVNPPTELGECISKASCQQRCEQVGGMGAIGTCSGPENCCGCFL